jgi:sulfonate transport system substrate-binding protein
MLRRTLFVAMAGLTLTACGAPKSNLPVLKVGSQKGGTKSLILASGVLEGAPYQVEWSEFPAAQHLLEAIGAGAVDLGGVGDAPFLFAYASGGKVRAVQVTRASSGGASTVVLVPKVSTIRTPADLKGKRIATGRGSIGHYLLLRVLEKAGLKPDDVQLVFLAPGDAKAAFTSGAIDAWVTWGPYVYLAQETDGARTLIDGTGLMSGYAFQVANIQSIANKRVQIADFLKRLAKAQRWAADHRPEYAAVLSKETGLDLKVASQTVQRTLGEPVPMDAKITTEEQDVLARLQAAGAITTKPDLAQAFDTSFNAALTP